MPSLYVLKCVTFTDSRIVCAGSNLGQLLKRICAEKTGLPCFGLRSDRSSWKRAATLFWGFARQRSRLPACKEPGLDVSSREAT